MTSRRGFLGAILAAGMAPAFIGARVLMPVRTILAPEAAILTIPAGSVLPGMLITIAGMYDNLGREKLFRVTSVAGRSGVVGLEGLRGG